MPILRDLSMRLSLTAFARARRHRAFNHAAGDAVARVARRLTHVIVGFRMNDDRRAIAIENGLFPVAE